MEADRLRSILEHARAFARIVARDGYALLEVDGKSVPMSTALVDMADGLEELAQEHVDLQAEVERLEPLGKLAADQVREIALREYQIRCLREALCHAGMVSTHLQNALQMSDPAGSYNPALFERPEE